MLASRYQSISHHDHHGITSGWIGPSRPRHDGAPRRPWTSAPLPGRRAALLLCRSKRSFYEVLGVPQKATAKDIKAAYRKSALKLHPDVNSAPDAKERFMEAKAAFETLVDDNKRAEYDRRLRLGFDASSPAGPAGGYGGRGGGHTSGDGFGSRQKKTAAAEEDNYSFDDLLRDLDKELSSWASNKAAKNGGTPMSLWDELESIGEELVDFLEDSMGISEDEKKKQTQQKGSSSSGSSSSSSSSSGPSSSSNSSSSGGYTDYTGKDWYKKYEDENKKQDEEAARPRAKPGPSPSPDAGASPANQRQQRPKPQSPAPKGADDVDEMLAALKKKYNKL